jgi:hypothetical protein
MKRRERQFVLRAEGSAADFRPAHGTPTRILFTPGEKLRG